MKTKGELTRQRIIEEAAPLFNQRGYAGCSMNDVMQAAGLEKGGIYRHFSSKEELAVESFNYALARATKIRTRKLDTTHGALEELRSLIKRFAEAPSAVPGGCPLMNTAIDADDSNPVLRKLALDAISEWRRELSAVVEEGIRRKEIRRKTDQRRVANTIIATLEGALMISRLEGSRTAMSDAQISLEEMLERIAVS